jgi:hypothetical protein
MTRSPLRTNRLGRRRQRPAPRPTTSATPQPYADRPRHWLPHCLFHLAACVREALDYVDLLHDGPDALLDVLYEEVAFTVFAKRLQQAQALRIKP